MTCRELRVADLPDCLNVRPGHAGDELVGRDSAFEIWTGLLSCRAFKTVVIESSPPVAGHKIVGFGASVFISPEFAASEVNHPRPGLNARLFETIASGKSAVLTDAELRAANLSGGLELLFLTGTWLDGVLNEDQAREVQTSLVFQSLMVHGGYRLNRAMIEVIGASQLEFYESAGVWRRVSEFGGDPRALLVMTKESATSVSSSGAAPLFRYREPALQLRPAEQELLEAALDGATDLELAAKLDLTVAAVKRRWLVLFDRIAETQPGLLADTEGPDSQARGKQKRHHLLAHVREHLEEIRH